MNSIHDQNKEYFEKAEKSFRELFEVARDQNEISFAMALNPESRGAQDAGWNTAAETQQAFDEYIKFIIDLPMSKMKLRVALSFYSHISEASSYYEIPKNMLRIAGGENYVLWPFKDLVELHRQTGAAIAPNSNKVLKNLVGHASALGLNDLSEVFRDAFDPEVRNGYAHADYIIWPNELRFRKKNGGNPRIVTFEEFNLIWERGVNFFKILKHVVDENMRSYNPPKTLTGHLNNDEPDSEWTIEFDPKNGSFCISCK